MKVPSPIDRITACRSCGSTSLVPFFDLGLHPFSEGYVKDPAAPEKVYPLSLSRCSDCRLVELNETGDPHELFSYFFWVTGTSATANEFAKTFYRELVARAGAPGDGYVLELASNDGTFLLPFVKNGFRVLGVDPAENLKAVAEAAGVPTLCEFWGGAVASRVRAEHGAAKMIFARNVLPHVANTNDFVEGIATCLADGGTVAIEAHYARTILEELHYDSIYHAHLCYFTIRSMEALLARHGLFVFDVVESPISGGSLIYYASKERRGPTEMLTRLRASEDASGVNELGPWEEFARRAAEHRERFRGLIDVAVRTSGPIVAYGASARSSTLLNYCGIDASMLRCVADKNTLKHGYCTPGSNIPIVAPEEAFKGKPPVVVILAWNFASEIIGYLKRDLGFSGTCIIPLPREPRVENV